MKYSILFIKCPLTLCPSRILKYHFTSKKKKMMRDGNVCPIIFRKKLPEKNVFFTQKRLEGTNSSPVDHTIQNLTVFIVKSLHFLY